MNQNVLEKRGLLWKPYTLKILICKIGTSPSESDILMDVYQILEPCTITRWFYINLYYLFESL